ncbi:hypothetical protein OPV22_028320 [Ensete ventricosum]|uniref:Protein kinase domain-containing protein n=1 Tax=Ensete ventricosum TaxID=4639 RepID=A0AAV8Q817_ENSVE|nr:hypothetical protein OPV22_028320 [Ensete ventricosum]
MAGPSLPIRPFFLLLLLLLLASISAVSSFDGSGPLLRVLSDLGLATRGLDHPCRHPGVKCDAGGAAVRVSLPSHRLTGSLSAAVGSLQSLRQLDLSDNGLAGSLPLELALCRALRVLDLRRNRISGYVPREISTLADLRVLDLSDNRLSGDLSFLAFLPNLERLSLSNNLFSGRVPVSLSASKKLRFLDFSGNVGLFRGDLPSRPPSRLALRRSLIPKRYVLAETTNPGNHNSTRAKNSTTSTPALAPSSSTTNSSSSGHHRHHSRKRNVRSWIVGLITGSILGIVSGAVLSLLFRLLLNYIRGRYKNPGGPSIFSAKHIRGAEDLAFLEKDDGLAALEIIGRGGCGEVYKAQLPADPRKPDQPGTVIAIKKIIKHNPNGGEPTSDEESRMLDKWMRQIRSEIQTVGHIRHRNLLPLLAHMIRPDCHYLIYEYMKNGSLEAAIRQVRDGERELDWLTRYRVALGVASGLEYLHVHHRPQIIHRDLKPANILLDDDMEARIADFGLAKEMPDTNTHMTASNAAGTLGYIAPEYAQTLRLTAKCDIYSFGVILAVLVVGRMPSDNFFQDTDEISLVRWLRNVMNSVNPVAAAVDPKLLGNGYEEQMLLVLRIAIFCSMDDPKERPNSKEVRTMLAQIKH